MKKRIYSILLACLLIAALAGCGKKAEAVATETTVAESQVTTEATTEESKAAEASADAFTAFEDPNGLFTASYPGTPKEMKQSASSEGTTIDLYSYMLEQEDALYNVMYSVIPEGASGDPAAMLEGAVANIPYTIEDSKDITLGEYQGKELKYSAPLGSDTIVFYHRVYITGDYIYQLQAVSESGERTPEIDTFFNSFALKK
ncbi:hypothetical protein BXY41_101190 [Lacrimispora xylanisolvens]|uniref:Lipoprotein n=1 Tax=Lacrimispora xylanisolvens TaxID=384636 RepID=A0A2S6HYJ6_9FIRM|nr:hypothetical protein [Hungatella xylanolytica]PPK83128.1 hypothetical protein BXY41_101190 [Hungatella xylanolytica]